MEEPKLHPLKDKWFVFYTRAVKVGENYDATCIELDYVTTIEEVYATLNTLPNFAILPADDSVIFARNKIAPKFESFPGGSRISFFTKTKLQGEDCVTKTVAAVLGETITKTIKSSEPIVDLVRISHKPHRLHMDSARVEVWARKNPHMNEVEEFFKELFRLSPGLSIKSSTM